MLSAILPCCLVSPQHLDIATLAAYVLEALGRLYATNICGLVRTGEQIVTAGLPSSWSNDLKNYLADFKWATGSLPVHADASDPTVGNRR